MHFTAHRRGQKAQAQARANASSTVTAIAIDITVPIVITIRMLSNSVSMHALTPCLVLCSKKPIAILPFSDFNVPGFVPPYFDKLHSLGPYLLTACG